MKPALVDTSVWIDFLRGKDSLATQHLGLLLESGNAYISETILVEVTLGARDKRQFAKYLQRFSSLPFVPLKPDWPMRLAEFRFGLKGKGVTTFLADAMIAFASIESELALFTTDKDFQYIAKHSSLQLWI